MEVISINPNEQKPKLGRRLIQAGDYCICHPRITHDDLLLVDADANSVTVDGYYLLERAQGEEVKFLGCRRIEISVLGGVNVVDGDGELVPFTADGGLRIVGRVLNIYRPKAV